MPRTEPTLPAIHVLHLIEVVQRWNVDATELLAGHPVKRESLSLPGARLPISVIDAIVQRARRLTGEPALGFYLGMQMKISWHGFLGFAAMSASTVRESLVLAQRFAPTRTSALALRLEESSELAALVIEETVPLGEARDAIIFALAVGLWQLGNTLTGRVLEGSAEFAFAAPDYFSRFEALVPGRVRFGQPEHRLVFRPENLDVPMTTSDAGALELARQQCQRELDAITGADGVVGRVRELLACGGAESWTIEHVARELGTSARTLKRRLGDHGTTFSRLLAEQRRKLATSLLRTDASIEEVASRLGYADPQSFSRAFKRWTDLSPTAYRKLVS